MLVLTSKKYEIEEPIKALGSDDETLYEFTMQITSEELKQINDIIFNRETMKKAKELSKVEVFSDEYEALEKDIEELALTNQSKFEEIVFKEHKEPFKDKVGEYKYLEMVEMIFDFFWKAFIEKKTKQINTMTTDLHKIGNN
jgi:hypothetical protein